LTPWFKEIKGYNILAQQILWRNRGSSPQTTIEHDAQEKLKRIKRKIKGSTAKGGGRPVGSKDEAERAKLVVAPKDRKTYWSAQLAPRDHVSAKTRFNKSVAYSLFLIQGVRLSSRKGAIDIETAWRCICVASGQRSQ